MHHVQCIGSERIEIVLVGKEPKFMQLGEVLNSLWRSDEIVEVHNGYTFSHFTLIHTSNLKIRFIHEGSRKVANLILLGSQPWLDDCNASWMQVTAHRSQRLVQSWDGFGIANRAEQTDNHIELVPKIEVHHVRMMKDDPQIALASDSQHLLVEIKPFNHVVALQKGDMPPCP